MPRTCETPLLPSLLAEQDQVLCRDQALERGATRHSIGHSLSRKRWQILLPDVYLAHGGDPSRRQLLIAALLYAGPDAAIDAVDACRFHGVRGTWLDETKVHVVVPDGSPARSHGYVVVRRTKAPIRTESTTRLRYVDAATAAISAARRMTNRRQVLAILSEALQSNRVTYDELVRAHIQGPPRGSRLADEALETLGAGTRSVPEADFRELVLASTVLPKVEYNVWLRLRCRRVVCVDALISDSAVVHETNGRKFHAREDLFEDMQERHDALTTSGFVALHNSGQRIRCRGREVITQFEHTHRRYAGRGMPPGVARI